METELPTSESLLEDIAGLRERIEMAEEALRAIRANEIDALVVGSVGSQHVRTLSGADLSYRTFVETMRQGAATLSGDGTILYCNHHFCDVLRATPQKAVGTNIYNFVEPSCEGLLRTVLSQAMSNSGSVGAATARISMRAADGSKVSAVVTATPLSVDDAMNVCVVVHDLTEHEARLAAEAASKAKDRFLAVLSHELRTPLMPAFMTVAALESDMSLPAMVRDALRNVLRNLELETKLIDDLLDLSRVMNDKLRLRRQPLSMHVLVERVADMLEHDLLAKSLKLKLQLNAQDTVDGDSARLQQALWNLLTNAIKFSNPGGDIFIRTSNPDNQTLQVQVVDSGAGIDPQVMPKIFEAFEQGDQSMMRRQGGLGLGLSIAKPIIEAHGGTLVPESAGAGKGATFTVNMPLCASPVSMNRESMDGDGSAPPVPLRVLLVEDHAETARLLSRLLQTSGHSVSTAGDVETAMRLAKEGQFDVVVSDIGLPDGTGYDLMKRIKNECRIPGVALTGYGMDDDLQKSTEAGFADHVLKPVDAQKLETVLWRVARQARAAD